MYEKFFWYGQIFQAVKYATNYIKVIHNANSEILYFQHQLVLLCFPCIPLDIFNNHTV